MLDLLGGFGSVVLEDCLVLADLNYREGKNQLWGGAGAGDEKCIGLQAELIALVS